MLPDGERFNKWLLMLAQVEVGLSFAVAKRHSHCTASCGAVSLSAPGLLWRSTMAGCRCSSLDLVITDVDLNNLLVFFWGECLRDDSLMIYGLKTQSLFHVKHVSHTLVFANPLSIIPFVVLL